MKAPLTFAIGVGELPPIKVIRGRLAGAWARAMSGHEAAPPSSVMNARRFIGLTQTQEPRRVYQVTAVHCSKSGLLMSALGQKRRKASARVDRACPLLPRKRTKEQLSD